MNYEADVIWLHVVSDAMIALAYFSIPIALVYFVRRRRDIEFNWIFVMFAAFILACGTTHLVGVWNIWQPFYRLDGLIKLATGIVSIATAITLWMLIPRAIALPGPAQLRAEIERRRQMQEEIERTRDELERRVEERTAELGRANDELRREIDERRAVEAALRESEARLRAVVETAVDGIITIDEQGIVCTLNPAAERIFGYSRDEVIGKNVALLMPEPYRSEHDGYLRNYHHTGHRKIIGIGREVLGQRKDGSTFPLELAVSESLLPDRRIFTGLVRDITERKAAEERLHRQAEELVRSNQELEQFASIISHDLRSPLVSISGCVELLSEHCQKSAETSELTALVRESVTRMNELISSLLAYSRVGSGGVQKHTCDMQTALHGVLAGLRDTVERSGAVVEHDPLPVVAGERPLLSQVLQNLIENAIKYRSKQQPHVQVSARDAGKEWVFCVRDNGIGINPAYFGKIFQMFQRVHSDASIPGSGVGLATCKKIVERHGGRIWVESEPGRGSTFCFTIPHS
jgi:PAS domain S-box-containing protein